MPGDHARAGSNVSFYRTAAGAQGAGYRACRRCLPDATPGSPEWDIAADVASRAMRLVSDGVVEREGVDGLAQALGYSTRQLNRVVTQEYGAGPLALARSRRAQTARVLIETTDLSFTDIAFAAGFASVRQFNDTMREVYAATPTRLRDGAAKRRRPRDPSGHDPHPDRRTRAVRRRRPAPLPRGARRARHRGCRARGGTSARCGFPHGPGVVRLELADRPPGQVPCTFTLADARDLAPAMERTRRLLDADCDPVAVDEALAEDPAARGAGGRRRDCGCPASSTAPSSPCRRCSASRSAWPRPAPPAARLVEDHGEPLDLRAPTR